MSPRELLGAARSLVDAPPDDLAGVCPRAAALLARQALEQIVDDALGDELRSAPFTVKLLCYRDRARDKVHAERLAATWSGLSEACHFHGYELSPPLPSLHAWIAVVEQALDDN